MIKYTRVNTGHQDNGWHNIRKISEKLRVRKSAMILFAVIKSEFSESYISNLSGEIASA